MTSLTIHTCCQYLTSGGNWREKDWHARVIIKSVKGEDFNGHWDAKIEGVARRLDKSNKDETLALAAGIMAEKILSLVSEPVTLVPIPNGSACVDGPQEFRTKRLADLIASNSKGLADVKAELLWKIPKEKQHKTAGYRHASQFIPRLELAHTSIRPIILIDDVVTSGSQMLAGAYLLRNAKADVLFGMAVGRTTEVQTEYVLSWVEAKIEQMII